MSLIFIIIRFFIRFLLILHFFNQIHSLNFIIHFELLQYLCNYFPKYFHFINYFLISHLLIIHFIHFQVFNYN